MSDGLPEFLDGPVVTAARMLIGMHLRTEFEGKVTEVAISEVEAYAGAEDPASHAFRGRTRANGAMFGAPGTIYVYRSYGMHWCMNIVTAPKGVPSAVLIRAGVPVVGEAVMAMRRGRSDQLTDGPGKLTQALGVSGDQDGTHLRDGTIQLLAGGPPDGLVLSTPRVGISKAKDRPWRFVVAVSAG
ncbi:MAG: DNA-3-methyladenine glycosylase [Acidimicrobiia bacterium]|nr:DNA-3-methyladenine glycosylase [Acidimicrobiia bacterium]